MQVRSEPLELSSADQIPPDFVVKSQAADIVEVIVSEIRRQNVSQRLWSNRNSRGRVALHLGGSLVYHVIRWNVRHPAWQAEERERRGCGGARAPPSRS